MTFLNGRTGSSEVEESRAALHSWRVLGVGQAGGFYPMVEAEHSFPVCPLQQKGAMDLKLSRDFPYVL